MMERTKTPLATKHAQGVQHLVQAGLDTLTSRTVGVGQNTPDQEGVLVSYARQITSVVVPLMRAGPRCAGTTRPRRPAPDTQATASACPASGSATRASAMSVRATSTARGTTSCTPARATARPPRARHTSRIVFATVALFLIKIKPSSTQQQHTSTTCRPEGWSETSARGCAAPRRASARGSSTPGPARASGGRQGRQRQASAPPWASSSAAAR